MSPPPHRAFIALGSNLGDRAAFIRSAIDALSAPVATCVLQLSCVIETAAVGGPPDSPPFLNAVVEVETRLSPQELLDHLLEIERTLGRERRERWAPRTIDLDLLLYDDEVIAEPDLKVPHPLMHLRRFVLEPIVRIAPNVIHPVLKKTMRQLLDEL